VKRVYSSLPDLLAEQVKDLADQSFTLANFPDALLLAKKIDAKKDKPGMAPVVLSTFRGSIAGKMGYPSRVVIEAAVAAGRKHVIVLGVSDPMEADMAHSFAGKNVKVHCFQADHLEEAVTCILKLL